MDEVITLSNAIILDTTSTDTGIDNMNNAVIGWDNALARAVITASNDQASTPNLFDYMTTSFWNAGAGTVTVDIVLPASEAIDCCAIAAGDWATAGTTIEVYSDAGVTKVGEVSGLKDNQPYMFSFDSVIISVMQVKFISSGDLNVGQVLMGESLKFPVNASIGLQLGKFNNEDLITSQKTENNAFGSNSTVARNRTTIAPFNSIPIDWLNTSWVEFSDAHKGKPVWFNWNVVDRPNDATFGHWSTNKAKYTSSFFSSIDLTIKGVV
jgi:hypothetical protein